MLFFLLLFAASGPPQVPDGAVLRPTFTVDRILEYSAGTAFVTELDGQPLVLSALHLFGPAAGLTRQFSAAELPGRTRLVGRDAFTNKKVVVTADQRPLPLAYPWADDVGGDIVAFDLTVDEKGRAGGRKPVAPLPLGDACPEVGAPVWLAARAAGAGAADRVHPATVVACDPVTLSYAFGSATLQLQATSGAPILDREGRVVGLHLGGLTDGAEVVGMAMSAPSIQAHLRGQPLPLPPSPWPPSEAGWPAIENPWNLALETLHAELLPAWGLSGEGEDLIREGLQRDPTLAALFDDISRLSWRDSMGNFDAIHERVQRWNALYDARGVPLRLSVAAQGQVLAVMTWWEQARVTAAMGDQPVELRLVTRMDPINIVDGLYSLEPDTPITLLHAETIRDAAVEALWPLLAPDAKHPWAAALRADLTPNMPEGDVEILSRAAPLRQELDAVVDAVNARSRCSGFGLYPLPWYGLDPEMAQQLSEVVGTGRCAPITQEELTRLQDATRALDQQVGLEEALEGLTSFLTSAVAIEAAAARAHCEDCSFEERARAGSLAALAGPYLQAAPAVLLCHRADAGYRYAKDLADELGVCRSAVGLTDKVAARRGVTETWSVSAPASVPVTWPGGR
ncbi:MAG: trypsin-like peptidase domain-containing protein [Alphaproteobacteria bacterium]|nr:trypsin-like peptidase domain-containing protein [Alphaproteobacteria bacterium]